MMSVMLCTRYGNWLTGRTSHVINHFRCLKQEIKKERKYWRFKNIKRDGIQPQRFNYFLVIDFEATCDKDTTIKPQEIIEFPCLKVNAETFKIEAQFHQYVQPTVNKILTPFCTDLTGIIQEMVNEGQHFKETLLEFTKWMEEEHLLNSDVTSIFVTSGDWDLNVMFPDQCNHEKVEVPDQLKAWINIKKAFAAATGHYPRGIKDMQQRLNIPHSGRLHSGIDDCHNIAAILQALGKMGFVFEKTGQLRS